MKRVLALFILLLLVSTASAMRASDYVSAESLSKMSEMAENGTVPYDIAGLNIYEAKFSASGNVTKDVSFKGIIDLANITIETSTGKLYVKSVSFAGHTEDINVQLNNNSTSIVFTNVSKLCAPVKITVTVDPANTTCTSFNYTMKLYTFKYMLMGSSVVTVSPVDGVHVETYKADSKPIPVFVKPNKDDIAISVNLYDPEADPGEPLFSMTVSSTHGNTVDVVIADVNYSSLDVLVDGNYSTTINVTDGIAHFALTGFSVHDITVVPSGMVIAPAGIDWNRIAGILMMITLLCVLVYLVVAARRR